MLSGVRLEVSEGEVSIEATDLELTARRVVRREVTVDEAGSVVAERLAHHRGPYRVIDPSR
jgi:DNA polymerase III sliding clamp (beta) subunit (PCNA family)